MVHLRLGPVLFHNLYKHPRTGIKSGEWTLDETHLKKKIRERDCSPEVFLLNAMVSGTLKGRNDR